MCQTKTVKKSKKITIRRVGRAVTSRAMIEEPNMRRVNSNVIFFDLGVYMIIILNN